MSTTPPNKKITTATGPKTGRRNGYSANTATTDPPHVCGICNKCFDRSKFYEFIDRLDAEISWFSLFLRDRLIFNKELI